MNGSSTALILIGLFLVGGIISFVRQRMPRSLVALVSIGAGLCLVAGVLRLGVWS